MRCWIVVLTGCGFSHGAFSGDVKDAPDTGGESIPDVRPIDAEMPDSIGMGTWSNIHTVFPTAPVGDDDPTLTADLLEMYFNRNADIYMTKRASVAADWATPTLVTELSSASGETTPEMTGDGLAIFVASDRPGTVGLEDIWFSTRATRTDTWSTPAHVDELCSNTDNAASAPTDDLLTIVQIGDPTQSNVQMYFSQRASTMVPWPTPQVIANVNSPEADFSPMLSQDHKALYFDSLRNMTDDDLYVATRAMTTVGFSTPTPITELDTAAAESDPWVSPDSHHIFFVRDAVLYEASR